MWAHRLSSLSIKDLIEASAMIEMNPYYAKSSTVGPVFDVATFSPRKVFASGVAMILFGVAFLAADMYLWNPKIVGKRPPALLKDLNKEIRKLDKKYPLGMQVARGVVGFIGLCGVLGGLASFRDSAKPNYYLRAGMGGLSLRVPVGLSIGAFCFKSDVLQRDLRWEEIVEWKVVQNKQFGAISANAGNLDAYLNFETIHGEDHSVSLDCFREPSRIIWHRLQDAMETAPARLDEPATDDVDPLVETTDDKWKAMATALAKVLWQKDGAVVFSDVASGKFVQIALHDGSLFADLPEQTLDEAQFQRATEFFARYGESIQEHDLFDRPGGVVVETQRSFQLDLGDDVERAVEVAVDLFSEVYGIDRDCEIVVESV